MSTPRVNEQLVTTQGRLIVNSRSFLQFAVDTQELIADKTLNFKRIEVKLHNKEGDYDALNKTSGPTFSRKSLNAQPVEQPFKIW